MVVQRVKKWEYHCQALSIRATHKWEITSVQVKAHGYTHDICIGTGIEARSQESDAQKSRVQKQEQGDKMGTRSQGRNQEPETKVGTRS